MKIGQVLILVLIIVLLIVSMDLENQFSILNTQNGVWSYAINNNFTNLDVKVPIIPNGSLSMGIYSPVSISIDSHGVAHIYASNLHDLFFAQGFYMAYTRLFQMEIQSLMASGNLSLYLGKTFLDSDLAMRYLGLPYNAFNLELFYKEDYPQYYAYMQSFSNGINYYIEHYKEPIYFKLAGFQPFLWSPFYSFAWEEYMTLFLTTGIYEPLLSDVFLNIYGYYNISLFYPYYPYFTRNITVVPGDGTIDGFNLTDQNISPGYLWNLDWYKSWATGIGNLTLKNNENLIVAALENISDPFIFQYRGLFNDVGSNSWVIDSNYSDSGYPILANDPHLTLTIPSLWIPDQLYVPGIMNVTGWSLAGIPGVLIGHTQNTSWGITDSEGNSANDYLEYINGSYYLWDGKYYPMNYRNFSYLGKNYSIGVTNNGPIIARIGHYGISVNWTAQSPSLVLISELMLDESHNFTDMLNALKYWGYPPENFALVSKHNAGYLTAGLYPLIKVTLPDGKIVNVIGSRSLLNGSNSNYSVEGYVPFSYLPHVIDPSRGFAFAPNQPTVWENYPYPFIGGFWSSGGRAMSIYKFLESHKMNISDTIALQSNLTDSWAGMLTPILMKYLETSNLSTIEIQALQYLSEWNHTAHEDSIGMTIYWYTISFIYNDTFYRSFNENNVTFLPLPFITSIIYAFEYGKFNFDGYNTSTLIPLAFKQAVNYLINRLGTNISSWKWGRVHFLYIESLTTLEQISIGPLPFYGDDHTVSVGPATPLPSPAYYVTLSSSLREISSPGEGIYLGVIPGGASEDFYNYFYENQFNSWYNHQYYNFLNVSIVAVIKLE